MCRSFIIIWHPVSINTHKSNVLFWGWQSNNKHWTHSEPDSSLCDGAEYLLSHRYVALVVLQVEQRVPDDGWVKALLSQLHLHLLKRPSYYQCILPEKDKWLFNGWKTFSGKFLNFLMCYNRIQQHSVYLYADEAWSCVAGEEVFDVLICSFAVKVHVFFERQCCHSNSSLVS